MSLIWCDSFESYDPGDVPNTLGRVYALTGSPTIDTGIKKTGTQSVKTGYSAYFAKSFSASLQNARLFMGFAFYVTGSYQNQTMLSFVADSGQSQAFISLMGGGLLRISRYPSTVLATGTIPIPLNTWTYVEVKVTITNSTSFGDVITRINGVTDIEMGSGFDTSYDSATLQHVNFVSYINQNLYYDDLYICDDQGTVNNTFLGECVVECLRPNGSGASSQWDGSDGNQVDNYLLVDESYVDDSDYVEGQVLNEVDLYDLSNLSIGALTVRGIRCVSAAGRNGIGTRFMRNVCRTNGVTYEKADKASPSSGWIYLDDIWETNPDTGLLWEEGAIGTLQTGVKVSN